MKADVITLENKGAGSIDLSDDVFGVEVRSDILQRVVRWQLAKRQAGTHKVKERGEVAGTSKKAYRQKGTGSARRGNKKAPILVGGGGTRRRPSRVGGGVGRGARVRGHAVDLPKKIRELGLKTALAAKAKDGKLVILDGAELKDAKTKDLVAKVSKLGWTSALVIDGAAVNEPFAKAANNIHGLDVLPSQGANVYDILRSDTLVLTKAAVESLQERLK